MKRIVCIGSSIDLPRENVMYSETWISLLRSAYAMEKVEIINRSQWAQTTKILLSPQVLEYIKPDIAIINLGIVDCAPRKIFERVLSKCNYNKYLNDFFKYSFWVFFPKRKIQYSFVKISQYQNNICNYINRFLAGGGQTIILCKIGIPSENMVKKNPKIIEQVIAYNDCLEKISVDYQQVKLVDPLKNAISNNYYLSDGYHVNPTGQYAIFETVKQQLNIDKNEK